MKQNWKAGSKLFISLLANFDSGKAGFDNHKPLVSNKQIVEFTLDVDSVPQPVQNRSAACQPAMCRRSQFGSTPADSIATILQINTTDYEGIMLTAHLKIIQNRMVLL